MVYAAFLRAVNVAGRSLAMAELRDAAGRLGFKNVSTILQSGNLVLEASKSAAAIERELEAELARRFRLQSAVTVRTAAELAAIVKGNPFSSEALKDPAHLVVVFLKAKPKAAAEKQLRAAIVGRERIALDGSVLYVVYPDGIGRSKLTAALIDRSLGTSGTARNWNTMLKLNAAVDQRNR